MLTVGTEAPDFTLPDQNGEMHSLSDYRGQKVILYFYPKELDTLKAHTDECVGMAANMIGVKKRIIVVNMGLMNVAMLNPVILKKSGPFETEEGCLSLTGTRKTKRFREIELEYQDQDMKKHVQKFTGWTAQIIQHECDHLEGIII